MKGFASIVVIIFILVLGVGVGILVMTSKKKGNDVSSLAPQTANTRTPLASNETCSPPGTPTCGPDGKPVKSNASAQNSAGGTTVSTLSQDVILKTIKLTGAGPQGLELDSKTGLVYVANNGSIISGCKGDTSKSGGQASLQAGANKLSIVDPSSGKETVSVPTDSGPIWPLVDNKRNVVYVAGSGNGKVAIHELGTGKKTDSINIGGRPHAFGLSESGVLIVSNTNDSTQTFMSAVNVNTKQVIAHHKAPELPHGIAFDSVKNVFYMVGVKNGTVAIIDAKTGEVKSTFAGTEGFGNSNMLAFSPSTRKLFISDSKTITSITVVDVDSQKMIQSVGFTQTPSPTWGMAVDETNGLLYAALPNSNAVGVMDIKSLKPLALIPVDECPYAVRLDTERGLGFTANQVNATVSVFDLKKVTSSIKK